MLRRICNGIIFLDEVSVKESGIFEGFVGFFQVIMVLEDFSLKAIMI